ncbi:MAG: Ig-like domain-containing protein [Clostridia bacterium]|nr:Ig-like domain-containing protein [Clostridia bacterium]
MKKKLLSAATLLACLCLSAGIAACTPEEDTPPTPPATPAISLSTTSLALNLQATDSETVTATVTPAGEYTLEWVSANTDIATVTASGSTAEITAVAKGETTITVSISGVEDAQPAEIAVSVTNTRPWTTTEETAMKDHLYGVVLFPTEVEDMEARWDAAPYNQLTVEGGWVEGNQLAEYAAQYTAADGWKNVTNLYDVEAGTAYMFEKAVQVEGETRYVRVFVYATTDATGDELATEGLFYITAYDPYVYEWPAQYLASALKELLSTNTIPSVTAQHYYLNSYGVTAYYSSTAEDGGYSAVLTAAGYSVAKEENYYRAVSPDEMFSLVFVYKDGALEISIRYNITEGWPAKFITNAFNYYSALDLDVTAFVLPEFEGDGLSFKFTDGYYNQFWINEGRERDMYGEITVSNSTAALTNAYVQKLLANGWKKGGTDDSYVKPIANSDQVNKISVSYSATSESTLITIYYFSVEDPTAGWDDDKIKANIALYNAATDTIPEYTGEITGFEVTKDSIYITVPEADFADFKDSYVASLLAAGFIAVPQATWTDYASPNGQYAIRPSTPFSRPNTLCLYIIEYKKPSAWDTEKIKELLLKYGSTLESLPEFVSETSYKCDFKEYSSDWMIIITASNSGEAMTQADLNKYKEILLAAGWTQDPNSSSTFISSDGKTKISLSYRGYNDSIALDITVVA